MPTLTLETSNEELHQLLVKRNKDRQREEHLVALNKRQYPLPVDILRIVVWYLPGYVIDWLPTGQCVIKCDAPLTLPIKWEPIPHAHFKLYDEFCIVEEDDDEYDDEFANYEKKFNPESDDY